MVAELKREFIQVWLKSGAIVQLTAAMEGGGNVHRNAVHKMT
jgi:hypothetical protein